MDFHNTTKSMVLENLFINLVLGYKESNDNRSYVFIQQLCGKRVQQFFGNENVFFATSQINVIYSWGENVLGQLARNFKSNEVLKPEIIGFFSDKNIIEMSCYFYHCLALTSDVIVYGWDSERFDPMSFFVNSEQKIILTPNGFLRSFYLIIKSIKINNYQDKMLKQGL